VTGYGWAQAVVIFAIVAALTPLLGTYLWRVFSGGRTPLTPLLHPIETGIYRIVRIDATAEMDWREYAIAVIGFTFVGITYLFALLLLQGALPLNPQHVPGVAPALAWNTAVSFATNTNWQFYSGESTMSYLSQMAGLAWHMFVAAGAGIAVAIALIRALAGSGRTTLGNFWVDLTRVCLYVLMPVTFVGALVLVGLGVPQNFDGFTAAHTLQGATQTIPQGPMASMEVIKEFGTNGGGFVNANSASPWENPTPLSDALEMILIFAIGAALTYTFGMAVNDRRQGWALFSAMTVLFALGFAGTYGAEAAGNPILHQLGVLGGNMEGKETRFGIAGSALFATMTTDTSTGAVNAMMDSFTALGGLVPLANMQLGELVFGGVGSGFYAAIVFVVLAVFIAGLMVGRTPEYLGKKIERREIQFAILAILVVPAFSLIPAGIAAAIPQGTATLGNAGPHGFSEILYAYTSGVNNNGSAFGGLGGSDFWNVSMGIVMLFGRLAIVVPVLALAGSLARKTPVPATSGTLATSSPTFVVLFLSVVVIVGALTFFPADALGPIVESLQAHNGVTF